MNRCSNCGKKYFAEDLFFKEKDNINKCYCKECKNYDKDGMEKKK